MIPSGLGYDYRAGRWRCSAGGGEEFLDIDRELGVVLEQETVRRISHGWSPTSP